MLHLETITSPAIIAMLLVCFLGMGFMVWFLLALTLDGTAMRNRHTPSRGVHYAADTVRIPYRQTAIGSTAHLAIGVLRIATALTSNTGLTSRQAAINGLHLVTPGKRQEFDFTAERRYRSG